MYDDSDDTSITAAVTDGTTTLAVTGTVNATALQEGGNDVYNSSETPGGELDGTWASPTIDDGLAVSNWNLTSPTITTQFTITAQADPVTDADGEFALDTDGWGAGYDAYEVYNGTSSAYLVATDASDTPTDGQVPTWNSDGSITWEDDDTGAGGGDPVLVNTTAITDPSGLDLTNGTGITITLNDAVSPDTATFSATLGTDISAAEIADGDHGDFTYSSGSATLDASTVSDNEIDYATVTLNDLTFDVGSVDKTEFGYLNGLTSAIQTQLDGKEGTLTDKASLESTISNVSDFAEADGDTYTGTHDFGGANLEIENGTDPDLSVTGEISLDTDGANETSDASIRGYDGTNQFLIARKLKTIQATIITPNDLADATRDKCMIWSNESGMTFTITKIEAWADTDDTDLNIEEYDADGASNNATVDAVTCTTGTGPYTATETTITGPTIEANHTLFIDFDDTDDPGWVKITICGWFNADVD
jgi:hypothetical protein